MPDTNDDDLRTLRSADPAAGVSAPAHLRSRMDDIPTATEPVPHRRRTRWLLPVAAATVIATAVGGYALGAQRGSNADTTAGPHSGDTVPVEVGTTDNPGAPITLGGTENATGGDAGGQTSEARSADSATETQDSVYGWWGGQQRFSYPNFGEVSPRATAYAVDGAANFGVESLAAIAATLGVPGEPTTAEDGWSIHVGDPYGSPSVMMYPDGTGSVNITGDAVAPFTVCEQTASAQYDLSGAVDGTYEAWQAVFDDCLAATALPTEEQARQAMSLFLEATGVDEATTEITVREDEYSRTLSVTAAWIVDGNVTTVSSYVEVAADGLLYGWGPSGEIVSLGEYDIVTANDAAERLNQSAYGASLVSAPPYEGDWPEYVPRTEPPVVPAAGTAVPWSIDDRELVSARLGLAQLIDANGVTFLAPAYEFTDTEGYVWSVTALTESELDTTSSNVPGGVVR